MNDTAFPRRRVATPSMVDRLNASTMSFADQFYVMAVQVCLIQAEATLSTENYALRSTTRQYQPPCYQACDQAEAELRSMLPVPFSPPSSSCT